eukprot:gene10012-7158_t
MVLGQVARSVWPSSRELPVIDEGDKRTVELRTVEVTENPLHVEVSSAKIG